MKRYAAMAVCSLAIVVMFAGVLMAGALDRQNVQTRTNSVTQSMIRVPGVVGMEQFTAMGTIQQAGLNVSVLPSKKTPKGMEGAEGMDGRVVSQVPAPGGLAMYGTTVTIYVNKPKAGDPTSSGTGSTSTWGTGSSSSTYSGQSGFGTSSTAIQGQTYVPQAGVTGMTGTASQPFQVQQYYFPSAGGAAQDPAAQGAVQSQGAQPVTDPNAAQAQNPSPQAVNPQGTPQQAQPSGAAPVQ